MPRILQNRDLREDQQEEEIEDMEQLLERSYVRLILAPKTDD